MTPLGSADKVLRAVTDMLGRAATEDPGPVVPWSLLDDLCRLIPAEEVSICEMDVANSARVVQQCVWQQRDHDLGFAAEDGPIRQNLFWRNLGSFYAGCPPTRAGEVRRWTDRYPGREFREQPLIAEFFRPDGLRYGMTLGFPAAAGHEMNLLFFRHSGPDFTDGDKDLLRLLRPHLAEAMVAAARRRTGTLTPREWQVLELAAEGHSNADIATILLMSVGTVRKHMEHIFDRTGVRTRAAAVARWMPERPGAWNGLDARRPAIGTGSRPGVGRS